MCPLKKSTGFDDLGFNDKNPVDRYKYHYCRSFLKTSKSSLEDSHRNTPFVNNIGTAENCLYHCIVIHATQMLSSSTRSASKSFAIYLMIIFCYATASMVLDYT